jgi:serine/threonine-protein kinase
MFPPAPGSPDARFAGPRVADQNTTTHRLDEVLGEYLEAVESGRAPNRQQFLAAYPDLAAEIEAFLADQDRFDALMAPLSSSSNRQVANLPPQAAGSDIRPGQVLGNYELLEEIARGGMGVVFKARQFLGDGTPRPFRIVALKMISDSSWGSAADVQRFRLEASAVAHLDHPNIVPLYEVGEHQGDSGRSRPFFSMKLVEGGSLARQVARFKGQPRDAAQLMVRVARAVEYAHQRGIIHRDLKPGNILLEGRLDGPPGQLRPLVADFGLAKRLRVEDAAVPADQTLPTLTQVGTAVGTPAYMPPEQALGQAPVTTAADVYSLGAILYELLTGRPPFRMPTGLGTLLEVLERDPEPPHRYCPGLDRDLEVICLKCLEKDPGQRYATAGSLADDLQRYLNREPIQARPVGRVERLYRWCRREPLLAGLSAAIVLSISVSMGLVVWQWQRAETERATAQQERGRAEQKQAEAEKHADAEKRQRNLADRHAAEVERQKKLVEAKHKEAERNLVEARRQRTLAEKNAAEAERQRAATDEAYREAFKIVTRFCVQLSEKELGNIPGLQPLRKEMLEAGLAHFQKFAQRNANDPELRNEIADTHFRIGLLTNIVGSKKDALGCYRRALDLYRDLKAKGGKYGDQRLMIARTLSNMANLWSDLGQGREAGDARKEAFGLIEELAREKPKDPEVQHSLALALNTESSRLKAQGKFSEALTRILRGRDITRELVARYPRQRVYRRDLALSYTQEGHLHKHLREPAKVLPCYQQARKELEQLSEAQPNHAWLRLDLSRVYRYIGSEYRARGQSVEALAILTKARTACDALVRANRQVVAFQHELAMVLNSLASLHLASGQSDRALDCYQQALTTLRRLVAEHPDVPWVELDLARAWHNLGTVHRELNRPADAVRAFQGSKVAFEELVARHPKDAGYLDYLAGTVNSLADQLQKLDRHEEALKTFEYGAKRGREAVALAPNNADFRQTLSFLLGNLARAHRLAKRPEQAATYTLERRKLWLGNPEEVYNRVREFLLVAQLVKKDSPEQRKYHTLALETLDLALQAGYKDFNNLRNNPRLAVLRERPEFQRLLREFETKNK